MRLALIPLPYCARRSGFNDEALQRLEAPILGCRAYFYEVGGLPHLNLLLSLDEAPRTPLPQNVAQVVSQSDATASSSKTTPASTSARRERHERREAFESERKELGPEQARRFETLRKWRARRADHEGVPLYVVLTNKELIELARRNPSSKSALAEIDGIGRRKIERYGESLLQLLGHTPSPESAIEAAPSPEAPHVES